MHLENSAILILNELHKATSDCGLMPVNVILMNANLLEGAMCIDKWMLQPVSTPLQCAKHHCIIMQHKSVTFIEWTYCCGSHLN